MKAAPNYFSFYPIPQSSASPQSVLVQEIIVKACITQTKPLYYIVDF